MVPHPLRGSDGSYSSFSSASSRESSNRKYVDPWDLENALYVRGKRISFASDPTTYSAASAILQVDRPSTTTTRSPSLGPSTSCVDSGYCYCDYDGSSYADGTSLLTSGSTATPAEALASIKYFNYCPYCDAQQNCGSKNQHHQPPPPRKSSLRTYMPSAVDPGLDTCSECSVCTSVAPPPPLLLFSGAGGRALSAAGLHLGGDGSKCCECEQDLSSFALSPRRRHSMAPRMPPPLSLQPNTSRLVDVDEQDTQLAYVYESPRARAKHSLPAAWGPKEIRERLNLSPPPLPSLSSAATRWTDRNKRFSLAAPPTSTYCELDPCASSLAVSSAAIEDSIRGPHAPLVAPPRHPCRWGMARTGHVAIDYSNAWMSLARRIRPSRS